MTIAGIHTVHELRNLWDAYSYEMQQMNAAVAAAWETWSAADPEGFHTFNADLARLEQAVTGEGVTVDELLAASKLPGALDEDETPAIDPTDPFADQFNVLLATFATGDPNGSTVPGPGGFDDLDRRFRAGPAAQFAPTYPNVPQPDAPDLDLEAYQLTDTAVKQIEKVTKGGTGMLLLIGAGVVVGLFIARR